jgi:hypothetical protein
VTELLHETGKQERQPLRKKIKKRVKSQEKNVLWLQFQNSLQVFISAKRETIFFGSFV